MAKKKKEHITFDRMADNKPRLNKKAFAFERSRDKKQKVSRKKRGKR